MIFYKESDIRYLLRRRHDADEEFSPRGQEV